MIRVLLICGVGASTGFMAQAGQKAARKRGLEMSIEAKSTAHLDVYMDKVDVLLLGSHFEFMSDEISKQLEGSKVVFGILPQSIFGNLDGEALVDYVQEVLKEKQGGIINE